MALKLNKISDAIIQQNMEEELQWIARKLDAPPPADADDAALQKYYFYLGMASSDVGMMLYQQERPAEEIRPHLERAGKALLYAISLRPRPRADEYRSPWEFEKTVNLIVCFADRELRKQAAQVAEWQYRNPPHAEQDAFAGYLRLLKSFIIAEPFDDAEAERLERRCLSDTATKEERRFVLPKLMGLRAAARQDQPLFERSLSELVEAHQLEALRGEYRRSRDGLMSLPALMLARLGQERSLSSRAVASPYLPLSLLEAST